MAQYYYIGASLPALLYDESPLLSSEELIELCREHLKRTDADAVERAGELFQSIRSLTERADLHRLAKAMYDWEIALRRELAEQRKKLVAWEAQEEEEETGSLPEAQRIAREVLTRESPFEVEMALQHARWSKLEELEVGHYFDTAALVAYMLKLGILERNQKMNREAGEQRFDEVYTSVSGETGGNLLSERENDEG